MDKNEWLCQFIKNIENYDQYKILNIESRCYESHPCKHNTLISFCNEEYEVLMRGDIIGNYQKHHKLLSLHFMNYISNDKN
jgi:hypothetical protein